MKWTRHALLTVQGAGIGESGYDVQLSDKAALISFEPNTWSSTFKPVESQRLSTPDELGLRLESAVGDGSVSHIHVVED